MRKIFVFLCVLTAAALFPAASSLAQPGIGDLAPDFTLSDQDGKPLKLSDQKGKIVVLEWFNPDCPFVKRHYQSGAMQNLAGKYSAQGVVWLAVNSTHYMDSETNKKWAAEQKLSYKVLSDSSGQAGKSFGAKNTPFMVVIDRQGKIAYSGAVDDDPYGDKRSGVVNYVAQALDELLANKNISVAQTKAYGCSVKYAG